MKKQEKTFDSVEMMRAIRDQLSEQIEGMSFEEEKAYIRQHVPHLKKKKTLKSESFV